MRAVTWHGKHDVRVDTVPDPKIVNPHDIVIKHHRHGHLRLGSAPLRRDDPDDGVRRHPWPRIHGRGGRGRLRRSPNLKVGDRVVNPFTIACGQCLHCRSSIFSACENSNPSDKAPMMEALYGYAGSGLFGYSHMMGGYAGGQARIRPHPVRQRRPDQRSRTGWTTSRCCSCPTSSLPPTRRRRTATSSQGRHHRHMGARSQSASCA